jgi:DNA repair photolyase
MNECVAAHGRARLVRRALVDVYAGRVAGRARRNRFDDVVATPAARDRDVESGGWRGVDPVYSYSMPTRPDIRKGRGAISNPEGRFESQRVEAVDDGWSVESTELPPLPTTVTAEHARSILNRNDSPDIGFDVSINPYRGCEHGCVYCLSGDTAVLLPNGRTTALAELAIGDEICGTLRLGHDRKLVATRVLAHWKTCTQAFGITLANGTMLVASGDHRFLTQHGWKFVTADEAGRPHLTTNDALLGPEPVPVAGDSGDGILSAHLTSVAGLRVACIEPLPGRRELYDITTGTGDFIANGAVSHNCYARPGHSYVNLSPGLDFETKLFYKQGAAALLDAELRRRSYVCKPVNIGASTDPYQPIERKLRVTRSLLEVLARFRHPVTIVTKSALIERDLDLLTDLARDDLVNVFVSITTLDAELKRTLEPRAPSPQARLRAVRALNDAGIPVGVLVAPVIPAVNDAEIEKIVGQCAAAGARTCGYVVLRLPYEVKDLFRQWLDAHLPLRAAHVMSLVQDMRGGRDNDPRFGTRMKGEGPVAELIRTRFHAACRRHGLAQARTMASLSTVHFRVPEPDTAQLTLL